MGLCVDMYTISSKWKVINSCCFFFKLYVKYEGITCLLCELIITTAKAHFPNLVLFLIVGE